MDVSAIKEVFDLTRENWPILKDVLAVVGGAAVVVRGMILAAGWKTARARRKEARRSARERERQEAVSKALYKANWYMDAYRVLVVKGGLTKHFGPSLSQVELLARFHDLTVVQACSYLDAPLPAWAVTEGSAYALVRGLTQGTKATG